MKATYIIKNDDGGYQMERYMMDGKYPRLFSAEELQLLGIKK